VRRGTNREECSQCPPRNATEGRFCPERRHPGPCVTLLRYEEPRPQRLPDLRPASRRNGRHRRRHHRDGGMLEDKTSEQGDGAQPITACSLLRSWREDLWLPIVHVILTAAVTRAVCQVHERLDGDSRCLPLPAYLLSGLSKMPRILYVSDCIFLPSRLTGQINFALSPLKSA